jgi:hypothetical protein
MLRKLKLINLALKWQTVIESGRMLVAIDYILAGTGFIRRQPVLVSESGFRRLPVVADRVRRTPG